MKSGYVFINNNIFESLFALSAEEQERGLMYMEPPTPIMTFAYNTAKINKFWMNATPAALDIVFCCNGKIIDICEGEPFSTRVIGPDKYSDLIIEFPKGTVKYNNIKIGHSAGIVKDQFFK